jgi:hypothetical protein
MAEQRFVAPKVVGSIPTTRPFFGDIFLAYSLVVKRAAHNG